MRRKGEPGSQQPTMEGRGPRQVNFFYFLPFALRCIYLCLNIMLPLTCETVWESHLSNSPLDEYLYSFCIIAEFVLLCNLT